MSTVTSEPSTDVENQFGALLREKSGFELQDLDRDSSFLELGFDSLFLIQLSQSIRKRFQVKVTFRQLIEEISTVDLLLDYLSKNSRVGATKSELQASSDANDDATFITTGSDKKHDSSSNESVATCETQGPVSAVSPDSPRFSAPKIVVPQTDPLLRCEARGIEPQQRRVEESSKVLSELPEEQNVTPELASSPIESAQLSLGFTPDIPGEASGTQSVEGASALQRIVLQQTQLMAQHLELLAKTPSNASGVVSSEPSDSYCNVTAECEPASSSAKENDADRDHTSMVMSEAGPEREAVPFAASSVDPAEVESVLEPLSKPTQRERFGPYKPVRKGKNNSLTQSQGRHLSSFIKRFTAKTQLSKQHAETHRDHFADPRGVAGYRRIWKEMVYQITTKQSKGSKLWDIDDNEYVDIAMGFGLNLFGQSPDFVTDAVQAQLQNGVEVGPQCALAGEAARMLCEFSRKDRATFCCTGSEAVMAAIRAARTVTGKSKVVFFDKDYHGNFEEVLLRSNRIGKKQATSPAAPGIPDSFTDSALVLEYCSPDSLEVIREHADEIAAVLVEPVQSADPFLDPRNFLQELRELTSAKDIALIMDEVITGFRAAQGGAQEYFGVWGDLATYGKILGGGLPIGALAGSSRYMDALDGGTWRYEDDSEPGADMTFFAGTFVRHPLAIAAAHSVLLQVQQRGPELQRQLTAKTKSMADELNNFFERQEFPIRVAQFASQFRFMFPKELEFADMLYFHLLDRGIFTRGWGDNCFLSTEHSNEDIRRVIEAVKDSCFELRQAGFFPEATTSEFGANGQQPENASPIEAKAQPLVSNSDSTLLSSSDTTASQEAESVTLDLGDLITEIQPSGTRTPLFCMPAADGLTLVYHELADCLGDDQPVYGVVSPGVYGEKLPDTLEELAARLIQDIKYVQPEGPYQVVGYCSGGTVAFEVAQQLKASGDEIRLLSCVETYNWIDAPSTNPSTVTSIGFAFQRAQFILMNFLLLNSQQKIRFLQSKLERVSARLGVWRTLLRESMPWNRKQPTANTGSVNMAALWREHDDLAERYVPKRFPGKMLECKPRRDYSCHTTETGLEAVEIQKHRLQVYPAGAMSSPFVSELAEILQNEMRASQRSLVNQVVALGGVGEETPPAAAVQNARAAKLAF